MMAVALVRRMVWTVVAMLMSAGAAGAQVRIVQTNSGGDNIHLIDPATNAIVGEIKGVPINHGAAALPDGSRFFFSSEAEQTLHVVDGKTLQEAIRSRVHLNAHMMTDELHAYDGLAMGFAKHDTIKHSAGIYAKGPIHTNTVEGFFSLLKRGIVGTFHHVGKGHLGRYVDEFAFRYNHRAALGVNDSERAEAIVSGAEGKRLTYRQPA